MSNPTHIAWLDMETTDSDPAAGVPLEVGMILTDWSPELREVARASLLIRPPGDAADHTAIWQRTPEVVRVMHTENGLWSEATTSDQAWDVTSADTALLNWISEQTGSTVDRVPLAGSGVAHLDLPFVKAWFPKVASRLTYWCLDVGVLRRCLELAGRGADLVDLAGDVEAKPHRGLADVELHVAEARRYLGLLGSIPMVNSPA